MKTPSVDSIVESSPRINDLRTEIRANRVSFPHPVPSFANQYRCDTQWRLAELYFIHNWTPEKLAIRYRVCPTRIRQSIRNWVRCALTLGYLQPIPSDGLPVMASPVLPPAYISSALTRSHEHV
jgi:hypothetical protein